MGTAAPQSSRKLLLNDILSDLRELDEAKRLFTRSCPATAGEPSVAKPKRRKKQQNIGGPLTVILGILLVLTTAWFAVQYVRTGIHLQTAKDKLRSAQTELIILHDELKQADSHLAQGDYKEACKSYETARRNATLMREQLLNASVGLAPGSLQSDINQVAVQLVAIRRQADEALNDPKVGKGGHGLVEYEGQWMTPAERDKRHEKRMKAEGKVRYEGTWLTPAEVARKRGLVFHEGQYISAEEYEKILAQKKPPVTPKPKPQQPPTPPPPVTTTETTAFDPAAKEWVLDNFEKSHNWGSVPWKNANPCRLSVVEGTETKRIQMEILGGAQDKSAIVRKLNKLDITSRSQILMDVDNQCGEQFQIAIALITNTYYESRPKWLRPGLNRGVSFDLSARDFKCSASNWAHSAALKQTNSSLYLHLLVYYNQPGKILFDNITAKGGK